MKIPPLVLLLVDRRRSRTMKFLKDAGYRLFTTFTPDHAVAICVSNHGIHAAVLDQDHFVETEGWSVAQSLKMVCRTVFVILIVRGTLLGGPLPDGVDAIVREHDAEGLLKILKQVKHKISSALECCYYAAPCVNLFLHSGAPWKKIATTVAHQWMSALRSAHPAAPHKYAFPRAKRLRRRPRTR